MLGLLASVELFGTLPPMEEAGALMPLTGAAASAEGVANSAGLAIGAGAGMIVVSPTFLLQAPGAVNANEVAAVVLNLDVTVRRLASLKTNWPSKKALKAGRRGNAS